MATKYTYLPYSLTGSFSRLTLDYLNNEGTLGSFFDFPPTASGISQAIEARKHFPVNREVLVATLKKQYTKLSVNDHTDTNIELLLHEDTFTVCTAHQPNLLTGYLYFIYKIIHAIKLASTLKDLHPNLNFVPVYYMGSEDNDLEELGIFRFRGKKYVWDGNGQQGAVGRMDTKGIDKLLEELYRFLGPPSEQCDHLKKLLNTAYLAHDNIADATQYLVHELFGSYGLVVINPDEAALKQLFIRVMENELLHQASLPIVTEQIAQLEQHYNTQATPRAINLFYLSDQLRERIELKNDRWVVLNTAITWTKDEIITELYAHPERFSPNVILRPLFQETILPNVAFIGGGAEVAYWLQLNNLFKVSGVFFPVVFLRQSILWVNKIANTLLDRTGFDITEVFADEETLIMKYIEQHTDGKWKLDEEKNGIEAIFDVLQQKAKSLDPTLMPSASAALTKMEYQISVLEKKMLRAEKRKQETQIERIAKMKAMLFPEKHLQERVENFLGYYLEIGTAYFYIIKEGILPFENKFLVVTEA